ncbi:reverse transcriptase domain-containing protein [Tanacetum coccineum]
MINQQPNATEITGNMSSNFWKFNNVSPNGVFGNKFYGDDLKRIREFMVMVVVHGGESGGDMVVPRSKNKKADALSKIAFTSFTHLMKQVLVEELKVKSINEVEVLAVVEEEGDIWMTPIYNYLTRETLPTEKDRARAVRCKSKCMHAGTRSVVAKAIRTGYYWPTMHADARKMIRECQDCQGPGKVKFLIAAMDYFRKWIKAKPVATITGNQGKKFVYDNIVCRFGLSREIISDNRKQFRDNPFKDWCKKLCIRQRFASVKHRQANDLVERANKSLGERIKARFDKRSKY